ncbi:hypothetical protein FRUB_08239 [Fimbriiglobus ruber]|uniref:Spermidine synthase n=1 Tax=Fimbriiglobus ruber TaxID=1908690 RepID=A0A225DEA7_9BACT|nr:hypothetical protein FRUB_08239 [Fimbriiglobus ruber]
MDLFLISGLILFLELACIRWFPAHVLFLTFFTNTVLLACFVGMSVGCLTARSDRRHLQQMPVWLFVALAAGILLNLYRSRLEHIVDVASQSQPDVVFFGAEANVQQAPEFVVPVELVAGLMFVLIAAVMVGPGQEMGRAFNRVPGRIAAYAYNIAGSLVGIVLFAACSWYHVPPVAWFTLVALGVLYFLLRPTVDATGPRPVKLITVMLLLAGVLLTVRTSGVLPIFGDQVETTWSPYYRVDYQPKDGVIVTNLIGHQVIRSREKPGEVAYHLPYLFNQAVARPPYRRILVIGAGSGNDVSRALLWAAPDARIDAVDIEPVIQQIGRDHHPDRPYDDPRVTTHLDDGRNFLRRAPAEEYDLVVYALVDSLVLHSGYGSIRLESYLFTREAFADVRRVLKPTGAFALYNYFRQGWLVARLRESLRHTFGADPVALTDPPNTELSLNQFVDAHTFFLAGREDVVGPVRQAFVDNGNLFWVPTVRPVTPDNRGGFSKDKPTGAGEKWSALRMAQIEDSGGSLPPATDEWPFLYTHQPSIPEYILRGIGLMIVLSGVVWFAFRPRTGGSAITTGTVSLPENGSTQTGAEALPAVVGAPSPATAGDQAAARSETGLLVRMFFLGAGFMLVETKAVVHMALLFGGTWVVNTVVFFAILMTALLGNLFVAWVRPERLWWAYIGLIAALAANLLVPLDAFLGLDRTVQVIAACSLVFAPVVFAGVIFPVSFKRAAAPDRAFGTNAAGALLGGIAENASMLVGFQYLLVVAVAFYLASSVRTKK